MKNNKTPHFRNGKEKKKSHLDPLRVLRMQNSRINNVPSGRRSSLLRPQVSPELPVQAASGQLNRCMKDPVVTLHVETGQVLPQPTPTVCHSLPTAAPAQLSCLGQPPVL